MNRIHVEQVLLNDGWASDKTLVIEQGVIVDILDGNIDANASLDHPGARWCMLLRAAVCVKATPCQPKRMSYICTYIHVYTYMRSHRYIHISGRRFRFNFGVIFTRQS